MSGVKWKFAARLLASAAVVLSLAASAAEAAPPPASSGLKASAKLSYSTSLQAPRGALAAMSPADTSATNYGLKAGDTLEIAVWREPDMKREVLVRPDGGISFPLAGDIHVAGMSVEQLRVELNKRLKKFITEPEVTVTIKETGGNTFCVIGKVNKPGEFPLRGAIDVMQALSIAGGTTTFAQLGDIKILRRNGEQQEAIKFRYGDVEAGRRLEQNILLKSGDVVVVP